MAEDAALDAIVERVRAAAANRTPLRIAGGRSKDFYGQPPSGELLDLRPLRGVSSYEPTELVVTVRAGTPLAELEAVLAEKRQWLAFEPPRFAAGGTGGQAAPGQGTVGGMVAAGLSGPARASAGGVRDFVLGATMLDGRGEISSFGGQVMKNVAGYDLSRLLAGSMGILCVILEVSLKVVPMPTARATLRFEFDQSEALRRVNAWAGQPLPLSASAWWNGMLVLRLAGAAAAVQSAAAQLGGEPVDPALADAFWDGLRDHGDEFFVGAARAIAHGATLWRLSVPGTAPLLALSGEQLIEWHGAQRWIVTTASPALMRDAAARAGGHAVAFRGDKSAGAFAPLTPPLARIHRNLKAAFDPLGILNPGRLYPGL